MQTKEISSLGAYAYSVKLKGSQPSISSKQALKRKRKKRKGENKVYEQVLTSVVHWIPLISSNKLISSFRYTQYQTPLQLNLLAN